MWNNCCGSLGSTFYTPRITLPSLVRATALPPCCPSRLSYCRQSICLTPTRQWTRNVCEHLRVPLKIRLVKCRPQHWTLSSGAKLRHLHLRHHPRGEATGGVRPESGPAVLPARPQGAVRARRLSPGRRRRRGPAAEGSSPRDGGSMRCQVSVLYFARSAELAGLRCETLSVPREITSLQLWEEIVKVHPRLAIIRDQVVFAVRQEYVLLGDQLLVLQPGDEVAIIPPISGG